MIYFSLWVLALLSIVLSVPIVAFVEKSKLKKAVGEKAAVATDAVADEEVPFEAAADEEVAVADDMGEFGEANPGDPDDFSAFDDFK